MQKSINIYDADENLTGTISETIDAELYDLLDGTLTLAFVTKSDRMPEINADSQIEFDGQYYRITQIQKMISDGAFLLAVSCEQESISLVDYDIEETFTFVGPPDEALARLLDGTGITATAEYDGEISVNVSGGNRRSVLLEIAALCNGELEYHGHEIRIVSQRGKRGGYTASLGNSVNTTHSATGRIYGNLYKSYTVNRETGEITCSDYLSATLTGEVIYNNYETYPVYRDSSGTVQLITSVTKTSSGSYRRTYRAVTAVMEKTAIPSENVKVSDITQTTDPRTDADSYTVTASSPDGLSVGDDVTLTFASLDINANLRITGIRYNPFNCTGVSLDIGEYVPTITSDYSDMQRIFLKKADAGIEFEKYIKSAEGIAGVKAALEGTFVTQDALTGFVTETELGYAVDAYINGEEGIASITEALSGKFVTVTEYGNNITLTASAQMFTKAAGSTDYSPSSITLTAHTGGTLTYKWYKDGSVISGQTGNTLTVSASSVTGSAATYKVVGTDSSGKTYSDQLTIAKLSDGANGQDGADGKDGQDGADGKDGQNGADGHTLILSNEYIEVPVDYQRYPKTARTYTCTVSVYRGTSKLTATTASSLTDGQFKVVTPSSQNGITVSQSTAGTLSLAVKTASALADITTLSFNVQIYGGITLPANITVTANMNDVAAGAYTVTSDINHYIESYITENGGTISDILSGEFVTADELNHYVKTSELESTVEREVADGLALIRLSAKETTITENVPTDTRVGEYDEYVFTDTKAFSFYLASDGWYSSQNAGVANSFSYGRINFSFTAATTVALQCVNYAEAGYDYGMIGELDTQLAANANEDSSGIMQSFKNASSLEITTIYLDVPAGAHYVDVKFIKDGSQNQNGDYFKIRAVAVEKKTTSSASTITLTQNGIELTSAEIKFTGYVTFESLSTPGATTIDGGNINTDNLHVENIYLGGDNSRKILYSSLMSNGAGQIHFGFMTTLASASYAHDVMIYAKKVWFIPPGGDYDSDGTIWFDTSERSVGSNKDWDWEGLYT